MPFLMWSSDYSVKVKSMDEQHRRLVELVNQLHDGVKAGTAADATASVLGSLVEYTKTHFTAEEKLMQSNGFPMFPQHKAEHDALTKQALELQKQVKAGQATVGTEALTFLRQWLINHIMGSDKKYGAYLNGKGIN